MISLFGVLKAGAIFILPSAAIKAEKLNHILTDSGAKLLITHVNKARIVKGERISQREVEHTLNTFPDVKEAAVIAVPDKVDGKALKAFVVATEKKTLESKQLLRHCAAKLEPVMLPKYIEFRERLPKSANGRIDKIGDGCM